MRVDANLQALTALSVGTAVTANNIANVNTDEFKHSRAHLETGPDGQGVSVAEIRESTTPGPLKPTLTTVEDPTTGYVETEYQYVEGSNTDLAREMVNLSVYQRAYEANVAAIRTWDEMTGTMINELI
ncbi:MAG: flagellar biosynthesis protein FlgG [Desulfovibrio sp.]|nr:MAG: flagellar biosynthesis protein FlgG [Desulfovibrio sp.]